MSYEGLLAFGKLICFFLFSFLQGLDARWVENVAVENVYPFSNQHRNHLIVRKIVGANGRKVLAVAVVCKDPKALELDDDSARIETV